MAIRSLSQPRDFPTPDMQPGTRLRRSRERLGLTYRDVERASYELAVGSPGTELEFAL